MVEVNGTFVAEIEGTRLFTDGIVRSGTELSASIAYIDFTLSHNSFSGVWDSGFGLSSDFPFLNVDSSGSIRLHGSAGLFDLGVIRYSDGTYGVFGGASIGNVLIGMSVYSFGGSSGSSSSNLSTYDYIRVFPDGRIFRVVHTPGDAEYNYVKVTLTQINKDGTLGESYVTNISDPQTAADMGAGKAPHIYDQRGYWDPLCFPKGTLICTPSGELPIENMKVDDVILAFDPLAQLGRGVLVPKRVVRLFQNETEEWLRLT